MDPELYGESCRRMVRARGRGSRHTSVARGGDNGLAWFKTLILIGERFLMEDLFPSEIPKYTI